MYLIQQQATCISSDALYIESKPPSFRDNTSFHQILRNDVVVVDNVAASYAITFCREDQTKFDVLTKTGKGLMVICNLSHTVDLTRLGQNPELKPSSDCLHVCKLHFNNSVGGPSRPALLSPLSLSNDNGSSRRCSGGKSCQAVKATSLAKQDFLELNWYTVGWVFIVT